MDALALATLSRLLDEALDRPPHERTAWLEGLGPEYDTVKPRLRRLLNEQPILDAARGFGTLPKLDLPPTDASQDAGENRAAGYTSPDVGSLVGPYRLVRRLAEGGMGAVWFAERTDGMINRPVALKLPRGAWQRTRLAERMAREREILASLTHPHIARLYDAGVTAEGEPYLALELVEGCRIDEHCQSHRLDVRARVALIVQVARAVAHAHAKLVVHRDLKPSNILVTPDGQVRLLDFGIATLLAEGRAKDSTLTEVAGRALTPQYASPEQVAGTSLGVASDVYSLGVVLYELVTGARPYRVTHDSPAALSAAILAADVQRPSETTDDPVARRALKGDLDTILLKALKKNPDERYVTMDALASDLRRFLDGHPVLAQPDSGWYRTRKFIGRNRFAMGATAAVLAAIVAGAGVAVWQARVARREQVRAEQVKEFIASIFRNVDPAQHPGKPFTGVELLEQAEQRLGQSLAAEPLVRAELLQVLGESYLGLNDITRAATTLTSALEEQVRLRANDPGRAFLELKLAGAEYQAGRRDEGRARVESTLARLQASGQTSSEDFVRGRTQLVLFLINEGKYQTDEAEAAAVAAADLATRVLGDSHEVSAQAYEQLGTVLRWRGKTAQALEYIARAHASFLNAHGGNDRHPRVINAQNALGRALSAAGDLKAAMPHLKAAAANAREIFGGNGVMMQQYLGTLATSQIEFGEIEEAMANMREAIELDIGGTEFSETYKASRSVAYGRALSAARRSAEALPHFTSARDTYLKAGDNATRPMVEAELGRTLIQLGRLDEAEPLLQALVEQGGPQTGLSTHQALRHLGTLYRLKGAPSRALEVLERARDATKDNARARIDHAQVLTELALTHLDLKTYDQAATLAAAAVDVLTAAQGPVTPARADALVALARAHVAMKRSSEAVAAGVQAHAFWQRFAADSPGARDAARVLAQSQAAVRGRP